MIPCRRLFLPLLLLALLPASSAAPIRARNLRLEDGLYHRVDDLAARYDLALQYLPDRIELYKDGRIMELWPEKRAAEVDGIRFYLNFAPVTDDDGNYYLHDRDVAKSLAPVFAPGLLARYRVRRILLDPGHGGGETGARGVLLVEKEVNLKLAQKLADRLKAAGFQVELTRRDDREVKLAARAELITRRNADLFVSIHQNSAANRAASGIETFAMVPASAPPSNAGAADSRSYAGNRFDALSAALALELQRELILGTGAVDRGVKRARFQVLRLADCPAVLIEFGFLSNAGEEALLGDDAHLDRLAAAAAAGLAAFAAKGDR